MIPGASAGLFRTRGSLERDYLDAAGYTAASPEVQALTDQLLIEAEALGVDTEALREDAARHTEGQSDDQYHAAIQEAVR